MHLKDELKDPASCAPRFFWSAVKRKMSQVSEQRRKISVSFAKENLVQLCKWLCGRGFVCSLLPDPGWLITRVKQKIVRAGIKPACVPTSPAIAEEAGCQEAGHDLGNKHPLSEGQL